MGALQAFVNAAATRDAAARLEASDAIAAELRGREAAPPASAAQPAAADGGSASASASGDAHGGGLVLLRPEQPSSEMTRSASRRLGPGRDMFRDLRMLLRKCDAALAPLRAVVSPDAAAGVAAAGAPLPAAAPETAASLLLDDADDGLYGEVGDEEYYGNEYSEEYDEEYDELDEVASEGGTTAADGSAGSAGSAGGGASSIAAVNNGEGGATAAGGGDEVTVGGTYRALRALLKVSDYLQTNRAERTLKASRDDHGVTFHVGQVLRHKKFGFRAVVFGWEERPAMDVSHWDGVVGLPSGGEQPFYRMIPDHDDCVSLLGGPRGVRYVAQENLEPLASVSDAGIKHELLPHLFHAYDGRSGTFLPVQQLAYWYPADRPPPLLQPSSGQGPPPSGADRADGTAAPPSATAEAAAASVAAVVQAVDAAHDLLRAQTLDASRGGLLEQLLPMLRHARTGDEAKSAEQACTALLSAHPDPLLAQAVSRAEALLEADDWRAAVAALDEAVSMDEAHADSYTRRATAYLRAGKARRALADATKALDLEPRHVAALKARGAALRAARRHEEAIDAFEVALAAHPWATGVVNGIYRAKRSLRARGGGGGERGSAARDRPRGEPRSSVGRVPVGQPSSRPSGKGSGAAQHDDDDSAEETRGP